ncbi:MAG: cystathionine beta-synthase [candidate division Zixibacteria bacterium 4484_95]|nr:MAG: cystathionine beta-synthase [candidate division Zixibacteria bacterium 4484_95]
MREKKTLKKQDLKGIPNISKLIGNTPIVPLKKITSGIPAKIFAKLEMYNPAGSLKDRLANALIENAEQSGQLKPGGTVIEVTSGNTGIAVAMVCAIKGYHALLVMSDKNSQEKQNMMKLYGAELVLTPHTVQPDDPRSNYSVAEMLVKKTPNSIYLNQYDNPANIDCHYRTTGPEIWEQTGGDIECVVAGAGTGGTISGIGRYLKQKKPSIKIIAIDSQGSMLSHYFRTGEIIKAKHYEVEGIGSDKLIKAMDFSAIDDMIAISDKESFLTTRKIAQLEGIFCGGSSGAVLAGAIQAVEKYKITGNVVIIFADSGNRYLSKLYSDKWMEDKGYI